MAVHLILDLLLTMYSDFVKVTTPQSERHDTGAMYTKLRVRDLQQQVPEVSLHHRQPLCPYCRDLFTYCINTEINCTLLGRLVILYKQAGIL